MTTSKERPTRPRVRAVGQSIAVLQVDEQQVYEVTPCGMSNENSPLDKRYRPDPAYPQVSLDAKNLVGGERAVMLIIGDIELERLSLGTARHEAFERRQRLLAQMVLKALRIGLGGL